MYQPHGFWLRRRLAAYRTSAVLQWIEQKVESWARYRSGRAVRELLRPEGPSQHQTTYETEHTLPVTDSSSQRAGGRPTQWHQHNILTGRVNPGHASVWLIIQIKENLCEYIWSTESHISVRKYFNTNQIFSERGGENTSGCWSCWSHGILDTLEYSEKWTVIIIHLCRWNKAGGWSREAQQVQRWAAVGSKALGDRLLCTQTLLTHVMHDANRQEVTAQHVSINWEDEHPWLQSGFVVFD